MIKSVFPIFLLILVAACGTKEKKVISDISIVPAPAKLTVGDDVIEWKDQVAIVADDQGQASAEFLSEFFKTKGMTISETGDQPINLSIVADSTLGKE